MTARHVESLLWGAAAMMAAGAALRWERAVPRPALVSAMPTPGPAEARSFPRDSLLAAVRTVGDTDPFRVDRRPASVAYDPEPEGTRPPAVSGPQRPVLVLRGVVGGASWVAVLEGVPGHVGAIVARRGDVLGPEEQPLSVRSIARDTVVVEGADTTWMLTVPSPR